MNTKDAYNTWASQYDTNLNKTRDLEGVALRDILSEINFTTCLEIGCGTGKNTLWLLTKATHVTAIDFSNEMLLKAKEKITDNKVVFKQADIKNEWVFAEGFYDLITFSLVLEHIKDLNPIFEKASKCLSNDGYVYIGELHPFKQYTGSKARFDTADGTQVVKCFTHHVSEFIQIAKKHGLQVVDVNEHFDENDKTTIPRILTILLKK